MTKTAIGAAPDPQVLAYVATSMARAGRTAHQIHGTIANLTAAFQVVTASVHHILEAYYLEQEAEARWADDGGPCD